MFPHKPADIADVQAEALLVDLSVLHNDELARRYTEHMLAVEQIGQDFSGPEEGLFLFQIGKLSLRVVPADDIDRDHTDRFGVIELSQVIVERDTVADARQGIDKSKILKLPDQVPAVDHRRENIMDPRHDQVCILHDLRIRILQNTETEIAAVESQKGDQGGVDLLFDEHLVYVRVMDAQFFRVMYHDGLPADQTVVPGVKTLVFYVLEQDSFVYDTCPAPFIGVVTGAFFILFKYADASAAQFFPQAEKQFVNIIVIFAVSSTSTL